MKAFYGSGLVPIRPWLLGAIFLPVLAACATTRLAEGEDSPNAEGVDVGYGEVDQERVLGSVATVEAEEADVARTRTLVDMLSRVPGVRVFEEPGGRISVQIRGANSFQGGEEPLFVVDGLPLPSIDAGLDSINPRDVDSITVLKDAGSTAIYGSRGANGVILIRTKRGRG